MSIDAEMTVTLAEVEVTDDYQVQLSLPFVSAEQCFTTDEALRLANELTEAVESANRMAGEDFPVSDDVTPHGFDQASVEEKPDECRDCGEGKHGACNGDALVDDGGVLIKVKCQCTDPAHDTARGAA